MITEIFDDKREVRGNVKEHFTMNPADVLFIPLKILRSHVEVV